MILSKNECAYLKTVLMPLYNNLCRGLFVHDTVEIINYSGVFNHTDGAYFNLIDIATNAKYVKAEMEWYLSQSRRLSPKLQEVFVWRKIASDNLEVNSNYGWCIFSKENGSQFDNAIRHLRLDRLSRRSVCIYNRPQMHIDFTSGNMLDFVCTMYTQHFIRNGKLVYIVNMRSNDAIYGFLNDFAWHHYVSGKMATLFEIPSKNIIIYWNAGSMHLYSRHFDKLEAVIKHKNQLDFALPTTAAPRKTVWQRHRNITE